MKGWKSGISKLLLVLIMAASFFLFQSNTYAATVGSTKLTAPEVDWQRIDDMDSKITYSGSSNIYTELSTYYNGTNHSMLTDGAKIQFLFEGTKLRVIGSRNPDKSKVMSISIDGTNYQFNANGAEQTQTLLFEKTGLSDAVHNVTITYVAANSSLNFVFDAIDIDDTGKLSTLPGVVSDLIATPNNSEKEIDLSWTTVSEATYYNVLRSETPGGPYSLITENVEGNHYSDSDVLRGVTYYYVITAKNGAGESVYSNEASAILDIEGRAILTIYLTNGTEKEYDLSMSEVNAFIDWYDQKDAGVGPAKYAFTKTWNKGPFSRRTEYVIFDKILTFNVDEYSIEE